LSFRDTSALKATAVKKTKLKATAVKKTKKRRSDFFAGDIFR